jgi:hypothetical protein
MRKDGKSIWRSNVSRENYSNLPTSPLASIRTPRRQTKDRRSLIIDGSFSIDVNAKNKMATLLAEWLMMASVICQRHGSAGGVCSFTSRKFLVGVIILVLWQVLSTPQVILVA